jgi:tetratricopeptide (TPR) repeat protein
MHYAELLEQSATNRNGRWRAIAIWRELLHRDPSDLNVRRRLARELMEQSAYAEARKHLEILTAALPSEGKLALMYGRSLEALGELELAAAAYENAIEVDAHDLDGYEHMRGLLVHLHLLKASNVLDRLVKCIPSAPAAARVGFCRTCRLLTEWGRFAEADEIVSRLQLQDTMGRAFTRFAAEIALHAGNFERGITLARSAVNADTTDYRDHLWLGRLLVQAGRRHAAEESFRRAVQLGSHSLDAWMALAGLLADGDQMEKAEAVLLDASNSLPSETRLLAVAMGAEALHRWNRADAAYQEVLAEQPNDPLVLQRAVRFYLRVDRPRQVEQLLRRLLAQPFLHSNEELAWARRQLALAITDARESNRLLGQDHVDGQPESVAMRRAHAFIDALEPEKRACSLLLILQSLAPNTITADEQLRLARLAMSVNDWPTARELMLDLLARDKTNPAYLTQFVQWLLERKQMEDAALWMSRLEKAAPDDPKTSSLRQELATLSMSEANPHD